MVEVSRNGKARNGNKDQAYWPTFYGSGRIMLWSFFNDLSIPLITVICGFTVKENYYKCRLCFLATKTYLSYTFPLYNYLMLSVGLSQNIPIKHTEVYGYNVTKYEQVLQL